MFSPPSSLSRFVSSRDFSRGTSTTSTRISNGSKLSEYWNWNGDQETAGSQDCLPSTLRFCPPIGRSSRPSRKAKESDPVGVPRADDRLNQVPFTTSPPHALKFGKLGAARMA